MRGSFLLRKVAKDTVTAHIVEHRVELCFFLIVFFFAFSFALWILERVGTRWGRGPLQKKKPARASMGNACPSPGEQYRPEPGLDPSPRCFRGRSFASHTHTYTHSRSARTRH